MLSTMTCCGRVVDCPHCFAVCPWRVVSPSIKTRGESKFKMITIRDERIVSGCFYDEFSAGVLTSGGFSRILRQLLSSVGELFSSELLLVDDPFT